MTAGESKTFTVESADAYGDPNPEAFTTLERTVFPDDFPVRVPAEREWVSAFDINFRLRGYQLELGGFWHAHGAKDGSCIWPSLLCRPPSSTLSLSLSVSQAASQEPS